MSRHSHLLVGFDGSKEGEDALRWAVREARLRRIALKICHAWHCDYPVGQIDPQWLVIYRRMAEHVLDHALFHVRTMAPTLTVKKCLVPGPAASALLHEAVDAELIVVGSRAHAELPVGSTAVQVAATASCPVVVVRDTYRVDGRVVIGVDGSVGSEAALAFGFEEAALRRLRVHAVFGYKQRGTVRGASHAPAADAEAKAGKRAAGAMLERSVAPWRVKYPQVEAWTRLASEPPREALLEAAAGAEMLVVGDRGAGGLPTLRLGAVSQAMLLLSPCTVAVAHPWRAPTDPGRQARTG